MIPRGETAPPKLVGELVHHRLAPHFILRDQNGQRMSLTQFAKHPVILSFMDARCTQLCPVVAESIRRALAELGPEGRGVGVFIMSTSPESDTATTARAFSRKHGMLKRWHYLLGPRRVLAPLWRAFYVYAAPAGAPASTVDGHTSVTYLLDSSGRERALIGGDPGSAALVRDIRILDNGSSGSLSVPMIAAPEVGHPAPELALLTAEGKPIQLRALREHTVLLNFWATWCTACRSEMPMLASWYRRLQPRGLVILGVDQQESAGTAAAFARQYHIPYPILIDGSGDVSARYGVSGLPTSFLVDRQGVVRSVALGTLNAHYLSHTVLPILKEDGHG